MIQKISPEIRHVRLDSGVASEITIKESENPQIHFSCDEKHRALIQLSVLEDASKLTIRVKDSVSLGRSQAAYRMDLHVSSGMLDSLDINAVQSRLSFAELALASLRLTCVSGEMTLPDTAAIKTMGLRLISTASAITIGGTTRSASVNAVNSSTRIDITRINPALRLRNISTLATINGTRFKNLELSTPRAKEQPCLKCETVGGRLSITRDGGLFHP